MSFEKCEIFAQNQLILFEFLIFSASPRFLAETRICRVESQSHELR